MHINNQETENKTASISPIEKDGINGRGGDEETNNGKKDKKKIHISEKRNCKTVEQKKNEKKSAKKD